MSTGEEKHPALVVAQSTALTKAGANSLATRGRTDLRIREEEAAEWLRKGLELRDTAPEDPRRARGPINPYANQLTPEEGDRRRQLLTKRYEMLQEAFRCFEMGHDLDPQNPELIYHANALQHAYGSKPESVDEWQPLSDKQREAAISEFLRLQKLDKK